MNNNKWIEIGQEYEAMSHMGCKPYGFKRVPTNYIFDEEKSVKWNREKVKENNERYEEEVKQLNREKMEKREQIHSKIFETIQDDIGLGISEAKARALWEYAYQKSHSYGWNEIISELEDLESLAMILLD